WLAQRRPQTMGVIFEGPLPVGVTAKDVALGIIARIGVEGGRGHVLEYRGSTIRGLSMEGRMTVCNMSIEAGARAGIIAPDDTTFWYVVGRPHAPSGKAWEEALDAWRGLRSDPDAAYDRTVTIDGAKLVPHVTWGTNPGMVAPVDGRVPDPTSARSEDDRRSIEQALRYMDLRPLTPIQEIQLDPVFLGSCTNARIEDLRAAAAVIQGKRGHP